MKTIKLFLSTALVLSIGFSFGQKGKNGTITLSGSTNIVNVFTTLTANAASGNSVISVGNSSLNSNSYGFSGNLEPGDLILIIQTQGIGEADMIGAPNGWDGTYALPIDATWGQITNYRNSGNNEYAEIKSIPNSTSIELRCGLSNEYTASGKVQIIRVPRFENLTVNGTLSTAAWNGSTGGVVAIEVNNNLIINGQISASELGFRGGIANTASSLLGVAHWSRPLSNAGGMKGESIRGWTSEYALDGGSYCKAAPANGGGGGNGHNAGGGGGGNAGDISNWIDGVGVPQGNFNAWSIETQKDEVTPAPINGVARSGGGRGGFTFSGNNQNANTVPAGNTAWGGDNHKNRGGLGGRPLDYSTGKIFLGGGGGAGDLNESNTIGGSGGNGGGIVYILNYGNVSGSGSILSLGETAENTTASSASFGNIAGNDGSGGGGAGGTVIVNSHGTVSGISINANGGNGGNQIIVNGGFGNMNEAEGPGGGGGGGYISISNGSVTQTVSGGINGVTNSNGLTEFPANGATAGGTGLSNQTITNSFLTTINDTICSGSSTTLTASVTGTLTGTITWYDAEVGGNIIGTNTLTTGALTANTTYWVGICPGNYLIPVSVIISPPITFNDAAVVIGDENCGLGDGTISGITIAGGTAPLTYEWNGIPTTLNLSSASAGSYTLEVIDAKGCITPVGTYVVGNAAAIELDETNINISNENCGNTNGGITGITTTGGSGTITYTWNGLASANEDLANVTAGSYTLIATDGLGCSTSSGPHVITNITGPVFDITGLNITDESCTLTNGGIAGITATGGTAPFTYSWNGNTTLSADTADLAAGSYTLVVTDAFGCSDQTGPYAVIDNAAPLLDTSGLLITNETCGSTNGSITGITTIGGSTPFSYSWNSNITLTADTSLLAGGSYTLAVTDALGCTVMSNPINVDNLGLIVDTASLALVNDACTLGNGSLTGITVSGGTPGYTFEWNGTTSLTPDTVGLLAGTYTLTITDNAGCTFTTNPYTILDNTGPTIDSSLIVVNPETCASENGSITGITSSGGLAPYTYDWNGGITSSEDISGVAGGSYTLIVTDGNGCSSSMGPIVVGSIDGPTIDASSIIITDEDCFAGNGSITGITITAGTNPYSYAWNGVVGNLDATDLTYNDYSLVVTDDNGCTDAYGPISVSNSGVPNADFDLSVNPISLGETLVITNNSSNGAVSYLWDLGDGTTSTNVNPAITYNAEGSYTVCLTAYTATNCQDTACQTVEVIEEVESVIGIPTAFSPNNDSHNDVLYVRGSGIESFTLMIYNRYGEKVFETNDLANGWDGTYKGELQNTGVFAYYLEYEYVNGDKNSLKGNITLVK
ncbi:MAG: gliding motility-associated C-terminal domain-containing protein [Flavobacteriales bacterium]|nr:gliding motility-associated C-terminal domain-containing protein [Flavobacteriales bacterium]